MGLCVLVIKHRHLIFAASGQESGHSGWHGCLSSTAERWDCGVYTRITVTNRYCDAYALL